MQKGIKMYFKKEPSDIKYKANNNFSFLFSIQHN